jgi:3-methyladenine DNA glycosylase AlkD
VTVAEILNRLQSLGSPENVAGMARYGITAKKAFGVAAPDLKALAREVKKSAQDRHLLAQELWETGVHDARGIAYLIDDPKRVTPDQMDRWAADFDNWAICDSTCGTLFSYTSHAYAKAREWSGRDEEFIKRAGFALMAWLSVHDKRADPAKFEAFLPIIEQAAGDDRNFVKKAVNWALRQIGKRDLHLNRAAIETAERISEKGTPSARWIAADALRELRSERVQERLNKRKRDDPS